MIGLCPGTFSWLDLKCEINLIKIKHFYYNSINTQEKINIITLVLSMIIINILDPDSRRGGYLYLLFCSGKSYLVLNVSLWSQPLPMSPHDLQPSFLGHICATPRSHFLTVHPLKLNIQKYLQQAKRFLMNLCCCLPSTQHSLANVALQVIISS